MKALNQNNFLRWYIDDTNTLPERDIVYDKNNCEPYIYLASGESTNIYFNPYSIDCPDGTISIIDLAGNTVVSNVGTMTSFTTNGFKHGTATISHNVITTGVFRLKLGSYVSNLIIMPTAEELENTCVVSFKSGLNIGSFLYRYVPSFIQKFRLPIQSMNFDYDKEQVVYKEESTGQTRSLAGSSLKWVQFKFWYADDEAFDALNTLLLHDTILINNNEYRPKSGDNIEKEFEVWYKLNHARFKLYDVSKTIKSRS